MWKATFVCRDNMTVLRPFHTVRLWLAIFLTATNGLYRIQYKCSHCEHHQLLYNPLEAKTNRTVWMGLYFYLRNLPFKWNDDYLAMTAVCRDISPVKDKIDLSMTICMTQKYSKSFLTSPWLVVDGLIICPLSIKIVFSFCLARLVISQWRLQIFSEKVDLVSWARFCLPQPSPFRDPHWGLKAIIYTVLNKISLWSYKIIIKLVMLRFTHTARERVCEREGVFAEVQNPSSGLNGTGKN